jgi:hypothetical protein
VVCNDAIGALGFNLTGDRASNGIGPEHTVQCGKRIDTLGPPMWRASL